MTGARRWLLLAGVLLFIAIIAWQGLPTILTTLSAAGAGLILVALFHLVPMALDAVAVWVFFDRGTRGASLRDTLMTRWVGESVNSLLPAGQLGGPVVMVRQMTQRGVPMPQAAAAITVSTTFQMLGQMVFALMGLALIGTGVRTPLLISVAVMAAILSSFYLTQRRGLFRSAIAPAIRFLNPAKLPALIGQADAFDRAVQETYARRGRGTLSFALNLLGWLVGTGEVYLILRMIKAPVTWQSALLLESLGQAIRGAAFVIPGALGVQEGGYLLLAPIAGLSSETALALSLAKRARELLLGVPGLLYLHFFERRASPVESSTPRRPIL
jgi:putative membrane protein